MIDFDALVIGPVTAVFGQAVTYQPLAGPPFTVTGVFDEAYAEQMPIEALVPGNITAVRPVLGVQLSQFAVQPDQGDSLMIQATGACYVVTEIQPDGHGSAILLLNEG